MRHRRGRKPSDGPVSHHIEWTASFVRLRAELEEYADRTGDPPPRDLDVALAVAEEDFAAHRDRWENYPSAPAIPTGSTQTSLEKPLGASGAP